MCRAIPLLLTALAFSLLASLAEGAGVLTVTGESIEAEVVTFEGEGVLRVETSVGERRFGFAELARVVMARPLGMGTVRPGLILTSGETWSGSLRQLTGETVVLRSPLLGEVSFPRAELAVVVLGQVQKVSELLAAPAALMVLANGDRVEGRLRNVNAGVATVDSELGKLDIATDRLAYVKLADFPPAWGGVSEPVSAIVLADGDWLLAEIVGESEGDLQVRRPSSGPAEADQAEAESWTELAVPKAAVSSVSFLGQGIVYLSDLKPAGVEETPFFDYLLPWQRDLSVSKERLSLRQRQFHKGLGVHSRCRLTYDLGGSYALFRSVIGIDDAAGGKGNCTFEVWVDGEQRFASGPVSGRDNPRVVQLDVTDARELALLVDFGEAGDVADRADWADALLVTREAYQTCRGRQAQRTAPAEPAQETTEEEPEP